MPISFIELIQSHKKSQAVCSVQEAATRIASEEEVAVIDVREPAEFENASIPSAVNIPRGFLEFRIADACSESERAILVHCKTGGRAVLAAKTLSEMGYTNVVVVDGTIEDLIAAVS